MYMIYQSQTLGWQEQRLINNVSLKVELGGMNFPRNHLSKSYIPKILTFISLEIPCFSSEPINGQRLFFSKKCSNRPFLAQEA
jgi:hypothetical protein